MALENHPRREKLQIEVVEIFIVQLKRTLLKPINSTHHLIVLLT